MVPPALDLGIALLRRGQGMADPAVRRDELGKAEKVFLAVRGQAGGQSDLFLGQVYYWMGKEAEGKKRFDQVLASQNRSYEVLMMAAKLLREVGLVQEARALVEEGYGKGPDQAKKQDAAHFRALMDKDLDDRITWLSRANQGEPNVKADLAVARANRAQRDGNDKEAAQQFREAIKTYETMPVNASTLNNSSIPYYGLYRTTGDRAALEKNLENLDKAVALQPGDSILVMNASGSTMRAAFTDLIGSAIDLKALKREGGLDLLEYLYADEAGRGKYMERVPRQRPWRKS